MILSCARAATIMALCLAIGLHWFLLQSVAWTTMLVKYSAESSLSEAVAKTFDGQHPCSLCRVVQNGKTSEKKSECQPVAPKFNLFLVSSVFALRRPTAPIRYFRSGVICHQRSEAPPVPPPRFALS